MIDYKKYKKVLGILNWDIKRDLTQWSSLWDFSDLTNEDKATAICELFDEKPINQRFDKLPYTVPCDLNRATC